MKLSNSDIIRIFGQKTRTPPELELDLAMMGVKFTATSFCKLISAVLFDIDWKNEYGVLTTLKIVNNQLVIKDSIDDMCYESAKMCQNIFRLLIFSTVFDDALKEKNGTAVLDKLDKIIKRVSSDFKANYRHQFQSIKWETVCELKDKIKERQAKLLESKI